MIVVGSSHPVWALHYVFDVYILDIYFGVGFLDIITKQNYKC